MTQGQAFVGVGYSFVALVVLMLCFAALDAKADRPPSITPDNVYRVCIEGKCVKLFQWRIPDNGFQPEQVCVSRKGLRDRVCTDIPKDRAAP